MVLSQQIVTALITLQTRLSGISKSMVNSAQKSTVRSSKRSTHHRTIPLLTTKSHRISPRLHDLRIRTHNIMAGRVSGHHTLIKPLSKVPNLLLRNQQPYKSIATMFYTFKSWFVIITGWSLESSENSLTSIGTILYVQILVRRSSLDSSMSSLELTSM